MKWRRRLAQWLLGEEGRKELRQSLAADAIRDCPTATLLKLVPQQRLGEITKHAIDRHMSAAHLMALSRKMVGDDAHAWRLMALDGCHIWDSQILAKAKVIIRHQSDEGVQRRDLEAFIQVQDPGMHPGTVCGVAVAYLYEARQELAKK